MVFSVIVECMPMHSEVEEILNLHRGQGVELHWRDLVICPTEEQYMQMVGDSIICLFPHVNSLAAETGGLVRMAVRLMQLFSSETSLYS